MVRVLDAEGRQNWRSNWLQLLAYLGDAELQRERWCHPERYLSPYWSFAEFLCMYFDDLGLDEGYGTAVASGIVAEAEAAAVAEVHGMLSRYKAPGGNDYDHAAILSDPSWSRINHAAARALAGLERLGLSEADRQAVRGAA